ncbi:rhodanese-like domain-containing protein [Tamlana sp. I1]|uniref:rhodanese-like domain-containing protein n=1 Tax=Tamlana sp. I1 TaxID=2762061 RepID=UPI00188F3AB0|nr:rhodanese-like domain-containing protein [Tamlana sp. I1]
MKNLILAILFLFSGVVFTQNSIDKLLIKHNKESVPYISTDSLSAIQNHTIILDAREQNEYNISHLKNVIYVGYNYFNLETITPLIPKKTSEIVVYCSLGIRSEDVAENLKKAGYLNVKNLYGGIFEWKNNNLPIYNLKNTETDSIHAYSKPWSKWLKNGIKIYE